MMQLYRTLEFDGEPCLHLYISQPYPDGEEWFCDWRIEGVPEFEKEMQEMGEDPMEVLQFAMAMLGANIYANPLVHRLTRSGSPDLNLLRLEVPKPGLLRIEGDFPYPRDVFEALDIPTAD